MVPPTLFISGGVAVLQLCKEVYVRFKNVKRFREDCEKLAHFVHRIESFITETEDDADMTQPGWKEAFMALHESLLEVVKVFEDCAKYGMLRSMINADELNLRLNSISQRLMLSLQLIPIQKAKATDKRLAELKDMQTEIRSATFTCVRAAEEQSAALKRLLDQTRADASKTQDMLAQVLLMLQADPTARAQSAAAAAAGPGPTDGSGGMPLRVDAAQLEAEVADLQAERERAARDKNAVEERYLEQVIMAITAMEAALSGGDGEGPKEEVPVDLLCPITYQLLKDPVMLVDTGQTYERAAIQEWLSRGNMTDPVSGTKLSQSTLVPNVLVRKLAEEWLQQHPAYTQQQQQQEAAAAKAAHASSAAAYEHKEAAAGVSALKPSKSTCQAAIAKAAADLAKMEAADCSSNQQGAAAAAAFCKAATAAAAEEEEFELNPKTAAILAAAAAAGASSQGGSSSGGAAVFGLGPDDKKFAQQAYARAVAEAAAAGAAPIAVAYAGAAGAARTSFEGQLDGSFSGSSRGGSGVAGTSSGVLALRADSGRTSLDATPSVGSTASAGASSITFARDASFARDPSTRSLPSGSGSVGPGPFATQQQAAAGGSSNQQGGLEVWPSLSAPLEPTPEQRQQQQMYEMQEQQQQQMLMQQQQWQQHQQMLMQQQQQQQWQQQQQMMQQQQWQEQQALAAPLPPLQSSGPLPPLPQSSRMSMSIQRSSTPPAEEFNRRLSLQIGSGGGAGSSSIGGSRQERAAAAMAAAEAVAGQHDGFSLETLQATLGQAAETRYKMAMRYGNAETAEEMLAAQQKAKQERQQAQERAYLQQHMERVMSQQAAAKSVRRVSLQVPNDTLNSCDTLAAGASYSSGGEHSFSGPYDMRGSVDLRSSFDFRSSFDYRSSPELPPASLDSRFEIDSRGVPVPKPGIDIPIPEDGVAPVRRTKSEPRDIIDNDDSVSASSVTLNQTRSMVNPSSVGATRAGSDKGGPSSSSSGPQRSSTWSGFGLGKSRKAKSNADAESAAGSAFDDSASVASVSSTGSAGSRRQTVGKSVLGMLKSIQYTMVYEDDKC